MSEKGFSAAASFFTRHNARVLLNGKYILMIGGKFGSQIFESLVLDKSFCQFLSQFFSDSVQRCAYKDLVALLQGRA